MQRIAFRLGYPPPHARDRYFRRSPVSLLTQRGTKPRGGKNLNQSSLRRLSDCARCANAGCRSMQTRPLSSPDVTSVTVKAGVYRHVKIEPKGHAVRISEDPA